MYPCVRVFVCVCLAAVLYVIPKSNNALIDSFPKVSHESHTKDRLGKGIVFKKYAKPFPDCSLVYPQYYVLYCA